MRPIKFRGRRKDNNEWIYGYLTCMLGEFRILSEEKGLYASHDLNIEEDFIPVDLDTIGQFTGLLDKNGKEIYEGDIVKDNFGRIMQIGFWKYKMCFLAISKTNFHHSDFSDWIVEDTNVLECEIIGNIHEHKHLLEQ